MKYRTAWYRNRLHVVSVDDYGTYRESNGTLVPDDDPATARKMIADLGYADQCDERDRVWRPQICKCTAASVGRWDGLYTSRSECPIHGQ